MQNLLEFDFENLYLATNKIKVAHIYSSFLMKYGKRMTARKFEERK
jgi:hypothetical protein